MAVNMRYCTAGGAVVKVYGDKVKHWRCGGCNATSEGTAHVFFGVPFSAEEIKDQAAAHAAECEALPQEEM